MLGWAASCRIRPKCSGLGSWDRSNCNPPWSGLCTNYAQFAKTFDRMPMISEVAVGKLRQVDVIKITNEMCSLFRQNKQRGATKSKREISVCRDFLNANNLPQKKSIALKERG